MDLAEKIKCLFKKDKKLQEQIDAMKTIPIEEMEDLFISTSNFSGELPADTFLNYLSTDGTYKKLPIEQYLDGYKIFRTNEIVKFKNDIFVIGNIDDASTTNTYQYFILHLKDCYFLEDKLYVTDTEFDFLDTGLGNNGFYIAVHALLVKDNFLYIETRTAQTDTIKGRIFKINPYDLSDKKFIELPVAGIGGFLLYDKNHLYTIFTNATGTGWVIKVPDDLSSYQLFIPVGLTGDKRVAQSTCFGIYEGKLYVPTLYNISGNPLRYNSVGWTVYDINTGELITELIQSFTTGQTTHPTLHWMTIFNDKMICSYRTGQQVLIRFNLKTLAIEETRSVAEFSAITDDNTIFSDGYIYLSTEGTNEGNLLKVKYNDFTDFSVELNSYRSAGSINVDYYKPGYELKFLTNTSLNTAQTATTLNTAYPNAPKNFIVFAPNVGTGMIYHKTSVTGQWLATVATILNP